MHDPPLNPHSLLNSGIKDLVQTPEGPVFFCTGCQCKHGPIEKCDICGELKPIHPGTNIMCKECYEKRKPPMETFSYKFFCLTCGESIETELMTDKGDDSVMLKVECPECSSEYLFRMGDHGHGREMVVTVYPI